MYDLPDTNLPSLVEIDKLVRKVKYGEINLTIQVAKEQIRAFISNDFSHMKFKDNGLKESLENTVKTISEACTGGVSGTLSVTFELHNGQVKELITQSNYKSTSLLQNDE